MMELKDWEVNIGSGWRSTKTVPWETVESDGGIGAENHDGFGEYRTTFVLPQNLKNDSLAFYTECLDDADEAYLNGIKIGETGRMPPDRENLSDYRSGVWEKRFYVLPDRLLSLNDTNEIRIKVFDYAGLGGFCYLQKPVIGPYGLLYKIYSTNRLKNDIPKTAVVAMMFLFCILLLRTLIIDYIPEFPDRKTALKNILCEFLLPFDFLHFIGIRRRKKKLKPNTPTASNGARILAGFFIFLMSFFFLFSELTYKFIFITSELFYCKYSAVAYFIALAILISVLHPDTFGKEISFKTPKKGINIFFQIALSSFSHPIFTLFFLLILLLLPPDKAWSLFIVYGLYYTIFTVTILFLSTGVNLLRYGLRAESQQFKKITTKEGLKRLFLFGGFMGTNMIYFLIPDLRNYGLLFVTIFVISFYLLSLDFSVQHGIRLPVSETDAAPLFITLKNKFKLTESEAGIAVNFYKGFDRNTVCRNFNITQGTLKIHLKSIYAKTIDLGKLSSSSERDKLHRLGNFLRNLKNPNLE